MTDPRESRKTALITGASTGIGYELAKRFARDAFNVVLVARNKKRLEDVAAEIEKASHVRAAILPADLTNPRAPDEIFEQLQSASVAIDALVNNAGFGTYGAFARSDTQTEIDMMRLNVMALVHLTRLFLPPMVERGHGYVLNVASTAAFQPGPFMAVYYASKAFVLSFSEAIASELEGTGVTVTALCPGPTRTGFQKRAAIEESKLASRGLNMDAGSVADVGYRGLMNGKPVVVAGARNRLLSFAPRFLPRRVVVKTVRSINTGRRSDRPS